MRGYKMDDQEKLKIDATRAHKNFIMAAGELIRVGVSPTGIIMGMSSATGFLLGSMLTTDGVEANKPALIETLNKNIEIGQRSAENFSQKEGGNKNG
jgi:hypothetical protein